MDNLLVTVKIERAVGTDLTRSISCAAMLLLKRTFPEMPFATCRRKIDALKGFGVFGGGGRSGYDPERMTILCNHEELGRAVAHCHRQLDTGNTVVTSVETVEDFEGTILTGEWK